MKEIIRDLLYELEKLHAKSSLIVAAMFEDSKEWPECWFMDKISADLVRIIAKYIQVDDEDENSGYTWDDLADDLSDITDPVFSNREEKMNVGTFMEKWGERIRTNKQV